jgi:hypothetical protein
LQKCPVKAWIASLHLIQRKHETGKADCVPGFGPRVGVMARRLRTPGVAPNTLPVPRRRSYAIWTVILLPGIPRRIIHRSHKGQEHRKGPVLEGPDATYIDFDTSRSSV